MFLVIILAIIAAVSADPQKQPAKCPVPTDSKLSSHSQSLSTSSSSCASSSSHTSSSSSQISSQASKSCGSGSSCPLKCKSTCTNPNPIGCEPNPNCNCKSGNVWTADGRKCIPINQCPADKGCNGDKNAHIMEKPPACPSTCDSPNRPPVCNRLGLAFGCACNTGYLLNSDGICVLPGSCPGGNPCGVNGTYAPCRMDCTSSFCPVDGNGIIAICDPAPDCPPGCVCKYKYRWRSAEDRTCILAQECPVRECKGDNQEWNSCPSPCLDESCESFNNPPSTCNTFQEPECYPQCTCKAGYARDENNDCIPGEECTK